MATLCHGVFPQFRKGSEMLLRMVFALVIGHAMGKQNLF